MIYLKLFWSFFQVGLFSFGGGYATLPLIQNQVVNLNGWLNLNEFVDIVTISQMTPGPVAINAATFVGTRIGGFTGALIATFGCILPSCIIVTILSVLYMKYRNLSLIQGTLGFLRPSVIGLIGSVALSLLILSLFNAMSLFEIKSVDFIALFLFGVSIVLLRKFKLSAIAVMLLSGAAGLILYQFV